jgi:hypothetical protein
MTKGATMLRRAVITVAGLAMTASLGVAGAGSAASPALHVTAGSKWTAELNGAGVSLCEIDTFAANHTFKSDLYNDKGTWSGGGATITMKWTRGSERGLTFMGTWVSTAKVYQGNPIVGALVKGVVSSYNGVPC